MVRLALFASALLPLGGCLLASFTPLLAADDTYTGLPDSFAFESGIKDFVPDDLTYKKRGPGFDVYDPKGMVGRLTLARHLDFLLAQFAMADGKTYFYYALRPVPNGFDAYGLPVERWRELLAAKNRTALGIVAVGDVKEDGRSLEVSSSESLLALAELSVAERQPIGRLAFRGASTDSTRAPDAPRAATRSTGEIDPTTRTAFAVSNLANHFSLRSEPDLKVCNRSGGDVALGIVRSYGMFAAISRGSWTAEGFALIRPNQCLESRFGTGQGLSQGYLSIVRKKGSDWETDSYRTDSDSIDDDAQGLFVPVNRQICWPAPGALPTSVNANVDCSGDPRSVRFNVWYRTNGNVTRFVLNVEASGYTADIRSSTKQ